MGGVNHESTSSEQSTHGARLDKLPGRDVLVVDG